MIRIKLKGYEFAIAPFTDSYDRRALHIKNKIITVLGKIGVTEDEIEIDLEPIAFRSAQATVKWYQEGYFLHFSYKSTRKYVENLAVLAKVFELEVAAIQNGQKTLDEFIRDFSEDSDVEKQRHEAREILGLPLDAVDLEAIDANFKAMAKKFHPDMPEGNLSKFKEINRAHKILRRELL